MQGQENDNSGDFPGLSTTEDFVSYLEKLGFGLQISFGLGILTERAKIFSELI